jgi:hypothetical protein
LNGKKLAYGGFSSLLLLAALRVGVRHLPVGRETKQSSSKSCGVLVWHQETVLREPVFGSATEFVRATSTVEAGGHILVEDVRDWHCLLGQSLSFVAVVMHHDGGGRPAATIFDAASARPMSVRHFPYEIDESWPSKDGQLLAIISARGEISVASLQDDSPPLAVFRGLPALRGALAWLDTTTLCWVASERVPSASAAAADAIAELWCAKIPDAPALVAKATWPATSDRPPWPGFLDGKAQLCGDALRPRDLDCFGLSRRRD